jgi:transposase
MICSRGGKKMWCVVELDQDYVEKMEDVLALYEKPRSQEEPVVCVDEKAVSLHGEVRAPMAMEPGRVGRRDSEYKRCGTANVFCGVEAKAGVHFTQVTPTRTAHELAGFLKSLADVYPQAKTIHLVMDNLNTHRRKALVDRYGEQDGHALWTRFTLHYTPKHGSWLNQAEIAIGLLARQCLGKRRLADISRLNAEVLAWTQAANLQKVRIQWKFDRTKAREKFRYSPLIMRSEN